MCVWKKTLPCIQHTEQLAPNWNPSPNFIAFLLLLLPFECFFLYSAYLFCVRRLFLWTAMARICFRCMYVYVCESHSVSESISCIWFSSIRIGLIRHCKSTFGWMWMISFTDFSFKIRTFNVLKAKRRKKYDILFILTVSLNGNEQNEQKIKSLMIQRRPKNCPNLMKWEKRCEWNETC